MLRADWEDRRPGDSHCDDPGEDGILDQGGSLKMVGSDWIPGIFWR